MKCKEIDTLMSLFLDGRLDPDRTKQLEEHCTGCARCARRLAERRSIEERARRIRPEEPPEEYWNTFSSRVTARIEAGGEHRAASGLKGILAGFFSLPAARPRLAAAVVSVAVIAALGILYLGRWGGDIVPPRTSEQVGRGRRITGTGGWMRPAEKRSVEKVQPADEESVDRRESAGSQSVPREPDRSRAAGQIHPIVAPEPARERVPPGEAFRSSEDRPAEAAGVGSESGAEKGKTPPVEEEKLSVAEGEPVRTTDTIALVARTVRERAARTLDTRYAKSAATGMTRAAPAAEADRYDLEGTIVDAVSEDDTMITETDLRMLIRTWTVYVARHPRDPIAGEGYLQAAIAYYLLARLTHDEAVISEGSSRIAEYAARTDDAALRGILLDWLRKTEALRGQSP